MLLGLVPVSWTWVNSKNLCVAMSHHPWNFWYSFIFSWQCWCTQVDHWWKKHMMGVDYNVVRKGYFMQQPISKWNPRREEFLKNAMLIWHVGKIIKLEFSISLKKIYLSSFSEANIALKWDIMQVTSGLCKNRNSRGLWIKKKNGQCKAPSRFSNIHWYRS